MKSELIDDIGVITLTQKLLGPPDTDQLYKFIDEFLNKDVINIVLDLKNVDWISSMGVGTMVRGLTSIRNRGGDMFLINLSEKAAHVLNVTQLARYFNQGESLDDVKYKLKGQ